MIFNEDTEIQFKCKDCGIEYTLSLEHNREHPQLCCDCYDEGWGMDKDFRDIPRSKEEY